MTASEFDPPITDPDSEELHRAVAESVAGLRCDIDVGATLAKLLRSDHPLHPAVRRWLAEALEGKAALKLAFRQTKRGPPTNSLAPMNRAIRNVAIADFILGRIESRRADGHTGRGQQKAAIGEAMKEFGLGETSIKDAFYKGRRAAIEFRERRKSEMEHQFRIIG